MFPQRFAGGPPNHHQEPAHHSGGLVKHDAKGQPIMPRSQDFRDPHQFAQAMQEYHTLLHGRHNGPAEGSPAEEAAESPAQEAAEAGHEAPDADDKLPWYKRGGR